MQKGGGNYIKTSPNYLCHSKCNTKCTSSNVCPDARLNCNLHNSLATPSQQLQASETLLRCLCKQVLSHLLPVY